MIKIDTQAAVKKLRKDFSVLSDKEVAKAQMRAINHTINKGKTSVAKEIRKQYNVSAADIKKSLLITKATTAKLYAYILISGRPLPIMAFRPRQTKKGVTFTVKKGNKAFLPGAFIVELPNGHRAVVAKGQYKSKGGSFDYRKKRRGKAPIFTRKGIRAYPDLNITELRTVSIPEAFANQKIQDAMGQELQVNYVKRLSTELNYLASKIKPQ